MTKSYSYYYPSVKPPEVLHKPGTRMCLRCKKKFESQGIGNRICHYCRNYRLKGVSTVVSSPCHTSISEIQLSDMETYW